MKYMFEVKFSKMKISIKRIKLVSIYNNYKIFNFRSKQTCIVWCQFMYKEFSIFYECKRTIKTFYCTDSDLAHL